MSLLLLCIHSACLIDSFLVNRVSLIVALFHQKLESMTGVPLNFAENVQDHRFLVISEVDLEHVQTLALLAVTDPGRALTIDRVLVVGCRSLIHS